MYSKVCVVLLLAAVCVAAHSFEAVYCGSDNITCVCGIGANKTFVPVELERHSVQDPATGQVKCTGYQDPYQACANISCFLAPNNSLSAIKDGVVSYFYPKELFVPSGGSYDGERFARQAEPCAIPKLENAAIKCWQWPNWMNCDINCVYGHALRSDKEVVTTKNINCRNSENVWKPHGFKDCEPYLNCKVQLVKPGNLKCKEPLDAPPYCEIECLDYDNYEATSSQQYECVDETFSRSLPHCAKVKDNASLIQKPS